MQPTVIAYYVLAFLLVALVGLFIEHRFFIRPLAAREKARADELHKQLKEELQRLRDVSQQEAEAERRQLLIDAKEAAFQVRSEAETEIREKRVEVQNLERMLAEKEEKLERKILGIEQRECALEKQEANLTETKKTMERMIAEQQESLQRIAGLTQEEAKHIFLKRIEEESRTDAAHLMRSIEEDAKRDGERRARRIITDIIQRCSVDQTSETTVSVVPLPNDDMKGRIIGREGRNIRAFETMTGVDLIIDDTPEAVVLSGFDPVRREVARVALTNLIVDGRIHPGRIEEIVKKAQTEVDSRITEAGERAVLETGMTGLAPEIVGLLGKMKYRTSYGQNVLNHSIEVSHLCGMLAEEIGADVHVAKRAGLLHDLGKAVDFEVEGPHALITGQLLRRYNEPSAVVHAAEAHHHDVEPETIEAILVICGDQISASRPGARRETLENYVRRLKKLEEIADGFQGVEKTFAVQAGREIRIIVKPEVIDDFTAQRMAHDIARRIENEMEYPGQIKVNVIRETRSTDFAR